MSRRRALDALRRASALDARARAHPTARAPAAFARASLASTSSSSPSTSTRRLDPSPSSPSRASRGVASSTSTAVASSSASLFDPVSAAVDAATTAHVVTGAPWWVTLGVGAVAVRACAAPISAKTIQASATVSAASSMAKAKKRGDAERVGMRDVMEAVREIREKTPGVGAHPAWLVVGPMTQIPFFVCAVMAVRRLSADGAMNGLNVGGTAWFSDLTLPAVDAMMMTAPMGPYGGILPVLTAAALFANVNANFATAAQNSRGMTMFKLFLEWMTLPMLVVGLQLPQAVHCYWLSSSVFALAQNRALSTPFAREALGVNKLAEATREIATSRGGGSEHVPMSAKVLELVKSAAKARADNNNPLAVNLLLQAVRADEARSSSDADASAPIRGDDLGKAHPSVLFALGQTYAVLKDWKKSALAYEYSARVEPDPSQRSRALMGAGVARARVGDLGMASEALGEANRLNASDASIKVALASALKLNGDPERALEILREAAELQPDVEERYVKPLEQELASRTSA